MESKKLKAFTLIELLVVIVVISIILTFVTMSLRGVQRSSRDDRRISDLNLVASALDQYATSNARIYPLGRANGNTGYAVVPLSSLQSSLTGYINSLPADPLGSAGYEYKYIYRNDGREAAVIASQFETGTRKCNFDATTAPEIVKSSGGNVCYYVAR